MKNFRSAIILFGILVVFLAAFFLIDNIWADDDKTIYKLEAQSIVEIDIESGTDKCSFVKNGDNWEMVYPKNYEINKELVAMMAKKLENLEALRVLNKNPGDLGQYGLDKPTMLIGFRLSDGSGAKLIVGQNTASNYQYYVMDSGSKTVCTITANDLEVFKKGKASQFRDRSFLTKDLGRIKQFEIKSKDKEKIVLNEYDTGKWRLIKPCEVDVKNDDVTDMLSALAKLEVKEFVEDDPKDLAQYGLMDPIYVILLKDEEGKTRNFFFGLKGNQEKEIYMMTDNGNGVYTTLTEAFDPEGILIDDLINLAPLSIGIGNVSRITVKDGGKTSVFQRSFSTEDDDFTLNGNSLSKEDFMALYVNIMALSAEGYDREKKSDHIEMSITFEFVNSEETQPEDTDILFLPFLFGTNVDANAKSCFIGLNGWHTKAHILRSVYEGVVFSHYYHINKLLKYRKPPKSIRISGGASRSGAWVQMFADVTGIEMEIVKGTEMGSLGSAICAGVASGSFESYGKAVKSMVKLDYTLKPDISKKMVYSRKFEAYQKAIAVLAEFWSATRDN